MAEDRRNLHLGIQHLVRLRVAHMTNQLVRGGSHTCWQLGASDAYRERRNSNIQSIWHVFLRASGLHWHIGNYGVVGDQ